jgi:hypothetical protein
VLQVVQPTNLQVKQRLQVVMLLLPAATPILQVPRQIKLPVKQAQQAVPQQPAILLLPQV